MTRHPLIWALVAGAAFLSIGGHAQQAQEKNTLEQRVATLERKLAEIESSTDGLQDAVTANTASLDGFLAYVKSQSKGAEAMVKTLQLSESQGFAAGINFNSRETLLAGWRDYLAIAQKGIAAEAAAQEEKAEKGQKPARSKR